MRLGEILDIIKFAMWVIPEIIGLIRLAQEKWPKTGKESPVEETVINNLRVSYVDPRVKTVLTKAVGREPTAVEVASVRDLAHSAVKRISGLRGHTKIWSK
jgi:hypothetical protein